MPEESGAVLSDDCAIVIGKKVCPPNSKIFWRLVDSGTHKGNAGRATLAALAAYQAAFPGEEAKAQADAQAFVQTAQCGANCLRNGTMTLGPFHSTQEWEINIHVEPNTARTWCWVGYEGIVFCK